MADQVLNYGLAVTLAVGFSALALLALRWWRNNGGTRKSDEVKAPRVNPYNPYAATQAQYMIQSAQAAGWLARDWQCRKSEGWQEVAPGVMVSPDGKSVVEL